MVEAPGGDAHGLAAGIDDAHAALAARAGAGRDVPDLPQRIDAELLTQQAMGEVQALGSLVAKPSVVTIVLFALVIVILMVRSRQQNVMVRL